MQLRLIDKIKETHDITTFIFEPLVAVQWIAGQSIKIEMSGMYGPIEHRFTISAAPHQKNIAITTRRSQSAYKQKLFALPLGREVRAFAIDGTFVWHESVYPHIFLAAGIGITPFHAMLMERARYGQSMAADLFYHMRNDAFVFKSTLDALSEEHVELNLYYMSTRIDVTRLQALPHLVQRHVYISGPSSMVDELSGVLLGSGISKQLLHRDWFVGSI